MRREEQALSANEAACVTGVPLKRLHRIIDAGLLGDAVGNRTGGRVVSIPALVGLKLAHETTDILTLEGRRRLVRRLLDDPEAKSVQEDAVSVDLREMRRRVQRGLTTLREAREMVSIDKEVMSGAPCFKGTRIPVHDIANMFANGDNIEVLLHAYPALSARNIEAALVYAGAYPRSGRPRRQPPWRKTKPIESIKINFDDLPPVS